MEKIQMNEEQARDIWNKCVYATQGTKFDFFISALRDEGYIKQNPVEKAKGMYDKYEKDSDQNDFLHVYGMKLVKELRLAIAYLEAEKERPMEMNPFLEADR